MSSAFYKELHTAEWERMDQLQAAASTPITVLTLLGGGLVVLAKSLDSSDPRFLVPFAISA